MYNAKGPSIRYSKYNKKYFCKFYASQSQSPFPCHMVHRAAPISVSIALGHASVNAVKATVVGWSNGSSACLTFPLHSHMSKHHNTKYKNFENSSFIEGQGMLIYRKFAFDKCNCTVDSNLLLVLQLLHMC